MDSRFSLLDHRIKEEIVSICSHEMYAAHDAVSITRIQIDGHAVSEKNCR